MHLPPAQNTRWHVPDCNLCGKLRLCDRALWRLNHACVRRYAAGGVLACPSDAGLSSAPRPDPPLPVAAAEATAGNRCLQGEGGGCSTRGGETDITSYNRKVWEGAGAVALYVDGLTGGLDGVETTVHEWVATTHGWRGRDVLDVGCGTGRLARFFAAADTPLRSYLGIDWSAPMVAAAREAARHGFADGGATLWPEFPVAFHQGDVTVLRPVADASQDVVIALGPLQNLPHADCERALAQVPSR